MIKSVRIKSIYWNGPGEEEIEATFENLRRYGYSMTFFVLGSTSMLNQVLVHVSLCS